MGFLPNVMKPDTTVRRCLQKTDVAVVLFGGYTPHHSRQHAFLVREQRCGRYQRPGRQAQFPFHLQGGKPKSATNEDGLLTEVVRGTNKPQGGKDKRRHNMAVQKNGTSSSSNKNGPSLQKAWAQVVTQVASAPSTIEFESEASIIDSSTYFRVYYSCNYVTPK